MSTHRILLVHDDRLFTNLYREKLEASGFAVDSTKSLDQAQKLVNSDRRPDLILLDLVLQTGSALEFLKTLRADPASAAIPALIFPSVIGQLSSAALQAGATKVLTRSSHPVASTLDLVKTTLGLAGLGDSLDAPLFQPDDIWITSVHSGAIESINQMRHCLPGLVSAVPDMRVLRSLWALAHGFAEKVAMLPQKPIAQLAAAFDLLMCDLNEMPEQINQSTLRTVGQAIDFLATLSLPENRDRAVSPSSAKVLVVDDEDSARQFITAAMQLAGVRNDTADTPALALEKLSNPFDLIFLDVGLPQMNGFELCTQIRALEAHKKTPIVFLTGMATFQNKAQASLSGGNDFVGKPFILPELGLKALIWILRGQLNQP